MEDRPWGEREIEEAEEKGSSRGSLFSSQFKDRQPIVLW